MPGSSALANTSVNCPSSRRNTASTDAAKSPAVTPCRYARDNQVHGHLGVGVAGNSTPTASSSRRSAAKFSMIPLCTTAIFPAGSLCGCALRSVGGP